MSATTDELRYKLSQLRADKLLLQSQLASLRALPELEADHRSPLYIHNQELGQQLRSLEEKAILYRSSAWTCFEMDLDVGRRARLARDSASADKDGDLALGIRLDTFYRARFYEPYYLVFARPSQLLDTMPQLAETTAADLEANSLADGLRLIRHTVPHFVPLASLVERYIPTVATGEAGSKSGAERDNEAGGLTLLSQFLNLPGVHAFLSDLHCHLQAYVSRRQQAMALQQLSLPGSSGDAELALEALGTEAFDLLKLTWRIPSSTAPSNGAQDQAEQDPSNPTAAALVAAAKRKRENPNDEPTHHLEVIVQYDDLQSDRLIDQTRPTGIFASTSSSPDDIPGIQSSLQGLRRPYGQVRVQLLEYAPELETRQRRAPGISKADLKALQPTITRRQDLEQSYAQEHDGESLDMDQAFERVAKSIWAQMRAKGGSNTVQDQRLSRAQNRVDWRWYTYQRRRLTRLLQPKIDPSLYRVSTPDFRALAAKYPATFGKFVKDDRGYEAKIDFQDAEAVRCLAETLLQHDFGIYATFSLSNLCPTFPFRLAYISLIHELLTWSLPTWHLLHHFQHQPTPADDRIRGLDIGTGASAIYPILGIACFPHWNFTATDIDPNSLDYAKNHIIGHPNNGTHLSDRVSLLHVDPNASFLPDQETGLEFTMCNPPFYTSFEEMDRSASLKKLPANAVCHGSRSEMIVEGGEVRFVQRMIRESIATERKVLWWTCMLGKLSSVAQLAGELKVLSGVGKIGGWGVNELKTGGGKTKRWVIMWTRTKLRLSDELGRKDRRSSLEKCRPNSTERTGKKLDVGPGWTRKELLESTMAILRGLDGCLVHPSSYSGQQDAGQRRRSRSRSQSVSELNQAVRSRSDADPGTLDVILTQESWTRRARRSKLQAQASGSTHLQYTSSIEPLMMVRISIHETNETGGTGLVVKVNCTYGVDSVKFESFAMFFLGAVERKVQQSTRRSTHSADAQA
ncbi:uncharacterized protein UDID_05951 [Ustilago sp. UG-2017a]|nr:uncharacterized protein UDID_05951 [Ustilago sp. UG-2017a]